MRSRRLRPGERHSPSPPALPQSSISGLPGADSVAFPALSTGAFGYPLFEACHTSASAVREAVSSVRLCLLVAFDERTRKFWERALAG